MTDYLALGYYTPGDETYIVLGQDNMYSCSICGYQANKKQRIQYHYEAKHTDSPGYQCEICQKVCPTKNAMIVHKSRSHRNS